MHTFNGRVGTVDRGIEFNHGLDFREIQVLLDFHDPLVMGLGQGLDQLGQGNLLRPLLDLIAGTDGLAGKQQIHAEGFVGQFPNGPDLLPHFLHGEARGAQHTQPSGLGNRHHQFFRGPCFFAHQTGSHAGTENRIFDTQNIAEFGPQNPFAHFSPPLYWLTLPFPSS